MAEIHRIPNAGEIERDASEWIARLEADDASDDDRAQFEVWRSAHPLHARTYDELRSTWQEFTTAGPLVRAVSFSQSMIDAGKPKVDRRWAIAAAASLAAVLIAGVWLWTGRSPESFQTSIGEHAMVTLPDGSIIELNSNSLARVDYSPQARVIRLERGEAYFKVSHDAQRPFWVVADGSWVRAVGTAFDVNIRPSGVRVTVSEGTVKVGSGFHQRDPPGDASGNTAATATLTAGDQIDIRIRAVAVRRLKPADVTRSTGWRSGTLYFENEPLGDVVAELSRYTTLQVVVKNPEVERLPVGGSFQANAEGADALIAMLKDGLGLAVEQADGRVYVDAPVPTPN